MNNRYKYALVDMSYILIRNLKAISAGKGVGEYNEGEVLRITIQTIKKIVREYGITADKYILIYDKWDKEIGGYYRTHLLKPFVTYKGSRVYVNEAYVRKLEDELKKIDPSNTAEIEKKKKEIEAAKKECYENQVKYRAKEAMINDLGKIGLPCVGLEGWEFDDLAWLSTCLLFNEPDNRANIIITKDTDLQYSLSPKMDYFKIPTGKSEPKIITYDEMVKSIPLSISSRGVSLYDYKAYMDSLGTGHNDMKPTVLTKRTTEEIILNILDGNYEDVNKEQFLAQFNSFDLHKFPRLDKAFNIINQDFQHCGHLGSLDQFHEFCTKYDIHSISDRYYQELIQGFNPLLFS